MDGSNYNSPWARQLPSADTPSFPSSVTAPYGWPMERMRRRGERVKIITGMYAGNPGTSEPNVYQGTVDYPDEWNNGHRVMLATEMLVTVRWEQVEAMREINFRKRAKSLRRWFR